MATEPKSSAALLRERRWMRRRGRLRQLGGSVASLWLVGVGLVVWELAARANKTLYFPPLSQVLSTFKDMWLTTDWHSAFFSDLFYKAVMPSLGRLARGWALAVVVGIIGGFIIGRSPTAARLYRPVIRFWMAVPKVVLLPIGVQIFGISNSMNVFLIFVGTVWLILINTADGVAGVDRAWILSARSMQLSRRTFLLRVLLPAASPQIFAGLRVSIGIGLILMIVSELFATTEGLGYQVATYQATFDYREMWSAFLLIALLGVLLNIIFGILEKRVLRWQRRSDLGVL